MNNHRGDGVPTVHFWSRVFSKDNAKQVSTVVGGLAATAGVAVAQQGTPTALVVGTLLQLLGGAAIGHDGG